MNSQPHRRVIVTADRVGAIGEVVHWLDSRGLIPEAWMPDDATKIDLPLRGLVVFASEPKVWPRVIDSWNQRAFQPLTAVLLSAVPGAAILRTTFETAGFHRIVSVSPGVHPVTCAAQAHVFPAIAEAVESDYSLVPQIAAACGGISADLAVLFARALDRSANVSTVRSWFGSDTTPAVRVKLHQEINDIGIGTVKRVLSNLKLIAAVYLAGSTEMTVEQIAIRVGFGDASYLHRLARARTGSTFRALDVEGAVAALMSPS